MREHERALSQIVDSEGGECQTKPRGLDRPAAKVSEIGIKRFGTGNGEKHEPQCCEADQTVGGQKCCAMDGVECCENSRLLSNPAQARDRQDREPQHYDGAEESSHFCRSTALHDK